MISSLFLKLTYSNLSSSREIYTMTLNLDLKLSQYEPWTITKTLEANDCGFQFLLPKDRMEKYILPLLASDSVSPIKASQILNETVFVDVCDVATNINYNMRLAQNPGPVGSERHGSYYFRHNWGVLVRAKGLKPGDKIGLCWDKWSHKFLFHVITVA